MAATVANPAVGAGSAGPSPVDYDAVSAAFDDLAASYDREVGGTLGAARAKAVATRIVRDAFRPGDLVLDIGCGTGVDACFLAQRGVEVVALDVSRAMLEETERRARARGVTDRVHTAHIPASRVADLVALYGEGSFSGAYSFFGSLNLEPSLDGTRNGLARLLQPGAPFYAGLVNRRVLWEMTAYPLLLRFDRAAKKTRRATTMRVSRKRADVVPVRLYDPPEFAKLWRPDFELCDVTGTNIFVPPPYLDDYARPFPGFISLLSRLEDRVEQKAPWNGLGYFSLVHLTRGVT
ncbi:MAG: class I SAM-dependent DNA methyltransferase [Thermoplasmatota archaeon]